MNPYYNQKYTREEIEGVLKEIKSCIKDDKYIIALNDKRQENRDFINEYNIHHNRQKKILLQLKVEDFCHTLRNTKAGYEDEILYVFVPQTKLFSADGGEEIIDIYIKFNVIELPDGNQTVVISFHKRNKPIDYLFR